MAKEQTDPKKVTFDIEDHYKPGLEKRTRSPVEAIAIHANYVRDCLVACEQMMQLFLEGKFEEAEGMWQKVQDLEHEADKVKNTIRDRMPHSFFKSISQDDMDLLLKLNDRVADSAEDVSDLLASRRTKVPDELKPLFRQHMKIAMVGTHILHLTIEDVAKQLGSRFHRKARKKLQDRLHQVSEMEWKADKVKRRMRKLIFDSEDEVGPTGVYHMLKLTTRIDDIVNNAENVEGYLRELIAK